MESLPLRDRNLITGEYSVSTISSIYAQYRTLDHTFLFKAKSDPTLVVRIYNISQECLSKQKFSSSETQFDHRLVLTQNSPDQIFNLMRGCLLSEVDFLPSSSVITLEECSQEIFKVIDQVKLQILQEEDSAEILVCPITQQLLNEPVIDEHGHTFEKEAIHRSMKTKDACPISRQAIHRLTPNRLVSDVIDQLRKKDPIPTLSLFEKDDPKLAKSSLKMAQTYERENAFENALRSYTSAFSYTKKSSAYAPLPHLYLKMKQPQKALLAFLYLAQYQIEEGDILKALESVNAAAQTDEDNLSVTHLLVKLLRANGKLQEALDLALSRLQHAKSKDLHIAYALYKEILILSPSNLRIYSYLKEFDFPISDNEKAHLLAKGASQAFEMCDFPRAQELCAQAESLKPELWIDQLVQQDVLRHRLGEEAVVTKLVEVAKTCLSGNLLKGALDAYKTLLRTSSCPDEVKQEAYLRIVDIHLELQSPKVQKWGQKCLSFLVERQQWKKAEKVAQKILKVALQPIPIYKVLESVYAHLEQKEELCNLYTQLGLALLNDQQILEAEATYEKACSIFHHLDHHVSLAEVLEKQGKTRKSVQAYWEAGMHALAMSNYALLSKCSKQIIRLDPKLEHLVESQKEQLFYWRDVIKEVNSVITLRDKQNQIFKTLVELRSSLGLDRESLKIWGADYTVITAEGHQDVVTAIIALKDGAFASCSYDRTIKIWNSQGVCLKTFEAHSGWIYSLIELKDGTLASSSSDKTVKLWNREGVCIKTFEGHTDTVSVLIELHDGTIVSGSHDKTIKLWSRQNSFWPFSSSCIKTLEGHTDHVRTLNELKNGILASGSNDNTIRIWGCSHTIWGRQGVCYHVMEGHTGHVCALTHLSDHTLVSGSDDMTIRLWGSELINSGNNIVKKKTLQGHTKGVSTLLAYSGGVFASSSFDNTVKLWNSHGACLNTLVGHQGPVRSLAVTNSGVLATCSEDKTIKFWTFSQKNKAISVVHADANIKAANGALQPAKFKPIARDSALVRGSDDGTIKSWNFPLVAPLEGLKERRIALEGSIQSTLQLVEEMKALTPVQI